MMMKNQPQPEILSLTDVTLGYPGVIALSHISFAVQKGEFVGVVGPNGSGKSTLLKGMLGLLTVFGGEIDFHGFAHNQVKQVRKQIGYVPQKSKNDTSFPALVKEVVAMGLYSQIGWFHSLKRIHWEMVRESLAQVGMADFSERPIGGLSGGQQQRVMIARALVANPSILMLDEPTASVDISAQLSILEILEFLNREKGITIMMVTHDINEIVHFCDKILLLNGETNRFGIPNEVLTKENLRMVYGDHIYVHEHHGHPHVLVGDFE